MTGNHLLRDPCHKAHFHKDNEDRTPTRLSSSQLSRARTVCSNRPQTSHSFMSGVGLGGGSAGFTRMLTESFDSKNRVYGSSSLERMVDQPSRSGSRIKNYNKRSPEKEYMSEQRPRTAGMNAVRTSFYRNEFDESNEMIKHKAASDNNMQPEGERQDTDHIDPLYQSASGIDTKYDQMEPVPPTEVKTRNEG